MRLNKAFKPSLVLGLCAALFATASVAAPVDQQVVANQGKYVARAADCAACHTAPDGGKPYAGGYAIASPLGTIYSTNITPSKAFGVGTWSEAQFARAVREGVSADGRRLYPAMPYAEYGAMSDADVHALYVYFTTGVAPVDEAPKHVTRLDFPYRVRPLMAAWDALYARKKPTTPTEPSDALARGRYLVDVLGHCSSCHTPRNILMASDDNNYLAGGEVGGWHAPNITSDPVAGIGGWTNDELVDFMKTGHATGKAQAAGGMAEAVENSLRHLSDDDLVAMATYLKSVPPKANPGQTKPSYGYGEAASGAYSFDDAASAATLRFAAVSTPTGAQLLAGRTYTDAAHVADGARLYVDACASCHQPNGAGTGDHYYPSLFHNSATGATSANNLVMAILQGVHRVGADGPTAMPAFARDMTDTQVAAVANYVAQRFGNPELLVTPADVGVLRAGGPKPTLAKVMPWILALGAFVFLLLAWWARRRIGHVRSR